jgi:D-amino-acid dehydrogenase
MRSVIVLGAGMVGVSVALHLRRRGLDVVLLDRRAPGEEASFGNGGLIQAEAVFPHPFPRDWREILRHARNRSVDVAYHAAALPGLAGPLFAYWRNSHPSRYAAIAEAHAALIAFTCDDHLALARDGGAETLLRPIGWLRLFGRPDAFAAAQAQAGAAHRRFGVRYRLLDEAGIAAAEPSLMVRRLGAIHWTDPLSVSDPHALTSAYEALFLREGGRFATGDARSLARAGSGWRVATAEGPLEASDVVVALGAWSGDVTRPLGYRPPLFAKRGYHRHFAPQPGAVLNRPMLDSDSGFVLVPMRAGIRLTTGAEFARPGAPPTPRQLGMAEPIARRLLPLGDAVERDPWMGLRPCLPDMLPAIGRLPGQPGAWCAFGHAHQGFTLGPTTGRLLADLMTAEAPFVAPAPYDPARFAAN